MSDLPMLSAREVLAHLLDVPVPAPASLTRPQLAQACFWHLAYCRIAERWFRTELGEARGARWFAELCDDARDRLTPLLEPTTPMGEPDSPTALLPVLGDDLLTPEQAEVLTGNVRLVLSGFIAFSHHWLTERMGAEGDQAFRRMHRFVQTVALESKQPTHDLEGLLETLATNDSGMIGFDREVTALGADLFEVVYTSCPNHDAAVRIGVDPNTCDYMCGPEFELSRERFEVTVENPENLCDGSSRCRQRYCRVR